MSAFRQPMPLRGPIRLTPRFAWKQHPNGDPLRGLTRDEAAARIAILELDNYQLNQRAELAEESLRASEARERDLLRRLRLLPLTGDTR